MNYHIKERKRVAKVSPDADGNHRISNEAVMESEQNHCSPIAIPLDFENGQYDVPEELKDSADEVYDVGLDATTLENTSRVQQPMDTNHTYHPTTPGIVEVNLRRSTRTRRSASYLSPSENVNEVQSTQLPLQSSAIRSARRCSSSRLLGGDQEEREDVCDMTADDIGEEESPSERQQELSLYSSTEDNRIHVPQTQTQAELDVDPAGT
eukprot:gene4060-5109_t